MATSERDVRIGDRVLRVRESGDLDGSPIIYFHGTPGSRLDIVWGENKAAEHHVRLVTFDRPGYGGLSISPFGLTAVGEVACQIADELGITRFATFGMSGGGPFSQPQRRLRRTGSQLSAWPRGLALSWRSPGPTT